MPVASRRSITSDECRRELVALTRRIGEPVRAAELPDRLLKAIHRHFGGLVAAREAAGLAPRKRITKWSTERVLAEIRRLSRRGVRITGGGLEGAGQLPLYRAIYFYIGSIKRARQLARVPEPSRKQREFEAWDADRVIEEIQSLHASGRSIALTKVDGRLVAAAGRYLGSWRDAVTAAGFDYTRVRLVRVPYEATEVLERLRKLAARNRGMTVTELRRHRLFHAVKRFFGSIDAAVERLGIEGWPRTVQERCMRRNQVVAAIRRRRASGQSVHASAVRDSDTALFYSATVRFGRWTEALRAAGVPLAARIKRPEARVWTRDLIVGEVRRIARREGRVTQKNTGRIGRAAFRHFGSLRAAAQAAGVMYGKSMGQSTVIANIRRRARAGCTVDSDAVSREDPALHSEAVRIFGAWHKARSSALRGYRPNRTWTATSVVAALRARKRAGKSLLTTDLMREDFGLYRAAFAHVGSFQEAVRRAGGDPVVRRDWTRDAVLAELVRAAEATRWVTSGTVSQRVYRAAVKLFGSFDAARRAARVPGPA